MTTGVCTLGAKADTVSRSGSRIGSAGAGRSESPYDGHQFESPRVHQKVAANRRDLPNVPMRNSATIAESTAGGAASRSAIIQLGTADARERESVSPLASNTPSAWRKRVSNLL